MKNESKYHKFFSTLRETVIMISFLVSISLFAFCASDGQLSIEKLVIACIVWILTLALIAIHYSIEGKDISSFFDD
ncbi:hypothetical protein LNP13_06890 [Apilactobacillus kunkeei]|uniref:hypothetical protein n=1 Tax=Apilactobacillus kunkeei TaxID=148814 RepID=UPI0006CE9459|nr:hypothetical protein [Apilactobacillus kunkeei]MCK8636080.1 hypothetical protein [Apilactobacillus kunkeei]